MSLHCCTVCGGRVREGKNATCLALAPLSITSAATQKWIVPFWCWFPGGWVCVCSRAPWVPAMNSPVSLRVSPTAATTPTGFFSQRFWGFISPCWNPGLHDLSHSPVVPPGSLCLATCPFCPGFPSLPLLPVQMNVSSLTLVVCLSDFHTVWFSGCSGCLSFLS